MKKKITKVQITRKIKNESAETLREAKFILRKPEGEILDDLLCDYKIKMRRLK